MKKFFAAFLLFVLVIGFASEVHGSGFLIYEHGAAAMGMGGAFVAVANNPSALFHNPAGIVWLPGTQISLGATFIKPVSSLTLPNWPNPAQRNIDQLSQSFLPPHFYLTHQFSDKVTAGIGVFAPYGLGTSWPEDYPLKYLAVSNEMATFFINPNVAVKLTDKFSVAVGVSYIYSSINLNLVERFPLTLKLWDVPAEMKGNGSSFAVNAGALYKAEKFSLGFNYRSGYNMKYKGDLKLDTSLVPSIYQAFVPTEGDVETTFRFPHFFCVGAAYNATEKLLLSFDVHYYLWSRFNQYVINITFPAEFGPVDPMVVPEDWKDTAIFRLGAQYTVSDKLTLRGGILYDQTPQPAEHTDPNLPDNNRWALTAGFGYKIGRVVLDLGYQLELFGSRTVPNRYAYYSAQTGINYGEGTYKMTAHLIGLSLSYVF